MGTPERSGAPDPALASPRRDAALALAAGLLIAAALPPFGWWPLALAGTGLWWHLLDGRPTRRRLLVGWLVGVGQFAVGISWFSEFSPPGWVIATVGEAGFWAGASVLAGRDPDRPWRLPATVVLADLARKSWPFGGIPLAGIDLAHAAGPLAPVARIGGHLAVTGAGVAAGVALAVVVRALASRRTADGAGIDRRRLVGSVVVPLLVVAVASVGGAVGRWTHDEGRLAVAAVQGGGERGYDPDRADADAVFERQVVASGRIDGPVDLVVWPENVIDVARLEGSAESEVVAGLARRFDATVVAGVTEDAPGDAAFRRFLNAAVAWGPDGEVLGRYDKRWRVPYGEYFPFRSFVEKLTAIPARDAVAGTGPGFIDTPAAPLGFAVSYEGFFAERGRAAVNAGAQLHLVPTNASSFSGSIVPTQQLAAARLRSWETGRWIVQAGPTGYTAVLDDRGKILERSVLGSQTVIERTVARRGGLTPYARWGDAPIAVAAAFAATSGRLRRLLRHRR